MATAEGQSCTCRCRRLAPSPCAAHTCLVLLQQRLGTATREMMQLGTKGPTKARTPCWQTQMTSWASWMPEWMVPRIALCLTICFTIGWEAKRPVGLWKANVRRRRRCPLPDDLLSEGLKLSEQQFV
mmetsp:Transcript_24615/g.77377  ORF Transcript_24615/g.77377 Transcript_24615/m.77377 type:complete len:127 (+) Transcript_24615:2837-3217(+)